MKLSSCLIVKNEEKNLPRCLESIRRVVDEIIVVDTGSVDQTPKIAEGFGARVYGFEWCDDFAIARNFSLQYARGEWILVLDADEVLVPDVIPKLQHAIALEDQILINLVRQEVGATQSPYSLVSRLFRNHPEVRFSRPYHAMVDDSIIQLQAREPHWKIATISELAILHEGYQGNAIAQRNKWQTAKRAMERYWKQHPADPYVASKLGALYVEIGEINLGIEVLETGLSSAHNQNFPNQEFSDEAVLYELYYHLGIAYRKLQNLVAAKLNYQAAINLEILPQLKLGAYNNLGNLLKDEGNLPAAKQIYETTLKIDPAFALGYYNLGMTLRAMGCYREAIAAYQTALKLNPDHAETHQNIGVILLQLGQIPDSLNAFKVAIALHEQTNSPEAQRLRQVLGEMGFKV